MSCRLPKSVGRIDLKKRTRCELAFAEILNSMDTDFEPEKTFQNGDRNILTDFYVKDHKLVIEIDGSSHHDRGEYDAGRDEWLRERHRVRTIRIANALVFQDASAIMAMVSAALQPQQEVLKAPLFAAQ